jgi:DNA ligase (NAD+)
MSIFKTSNAFSVYFAIKIERMYSLQQTQHLEKLSKDFLKNDAAQNQVQALREVLRFHEYRYYVANEPLISDTEYDLLYKQLEALERAHPEIITKDSPTQ